MSWQEAIEKKYPYDIEVKVKGEWSHYGKACMYSGYSAMQIIDECFNCEAVRYINRANGQVVAEY